MRVRWTFLRHGESIANAEGWLAGRSDVPLTARGRAQARRVRDPLRDLPFARVLASDLQRAALTARIAVPHRAVRWCAGLRERALGRWEGRPRATLDDRERAILTSDRGAPPGGESHADVVLRLARTLAALDDGTDTLVVTHGGVIRAALQLMDGLPSQRATRMRIPNTGIQTRALLPGTWHARLRLLEDAIQHAREDQDARP